MNLLILLFLSIGGVLAAYFYNTRHYYRYGYKIGKTIVKRFRPEIDKKLLSPHSKKNMQERVEIVKEMVFQLGLSEYVKDYNQTVKHLQEQLASLKKAFGVQKEKILKKFDEKDKQLTEEVKKLEITLKTKEEELSQLKRDEDNRNEVLEQSDKTKIQSQYFFSTLILKVRESLDKTTQTLETDLLRYSYAGIVAILLYGDYSISYSIVNDLFKIEYRNQFQIVIFSIIFMVVFLVFAGLALEALDRYSTKYKVLVNRIRTISVIALTLILTTVYMFMITLSALEAKVELLDVLLRILFVPMVLAVALTIRKIQKNYGFSFLFTPIKVVLYLLLIVIFNLLLLFEVTIFYIRRYIQKEKYESKTKLTVAEEVENIKREILQKNGLHFSFKEQLELEINKLTEQYQKDVSKLEKKLNSLNSEMAKIRKGCENGIISTLSLKATVPS